MKILVYLTILLGLIISLNDVYCQSSSILTTITTTTKPPPTTRKTLKCYVCAEPSFDNKSWPCSFTTKANDCYLIDPTFNQCVTLTVPNGYSGDDKIYKFCSKGFENSYKYYSSVLIAYTQNVTSSTMKYVYLGSSYYNVRVCNTDYCNSESMSTPYPTQKLTTSNNGIYCYVNVKSLTNSNYYDCQKINPNFDQCINAYSPDTFDAYSFCGTGYSNGYHMISKIYYIDTNGNVAYYDLSTFMMLKVCTSSNCNQFNTIPQMPVTSPTKAKGVYCYTCDPSSPSSCSYSQQITDCSLIGPEYNQCITASKYNGNTQATEFIKFCGNGYSNGNQLVYMIYYTSYYYLSPGNTVNWYFPFTYYDLSVCTTDYCNSYNPITYQSSTSYNFFSMSQNNGLYCYSCSRTFDGSSCESNYNSYGCPSYSDTCFTLKDYSTNEIIKSCGSYASYSYTIIIYPTGRYLSRDSYQVLQECKSSYCNNYYSYSYSNPTNYYHLTSQSPQALYCYNCSDCERNKNIERVNCNLLGFSDRCLTLRDYSTNEIIKSCASSYNQNTLIIYPSWRYLNRDSYEIIQECQSNYCNNYAIHSYDNDFYSLINGTDLSKTVIVNNAMQMMNNFYNVVSKMFGYLNDETESQTQD